MRWKGAEGEWEERDTVPLESLCKSATNEQNDVDRLSRGALVPYNPVLSV